MDPPPIAVRLRFSRRLERQRAENALAAAESARRRANLPVLDLTESNPTAVGLSEASPEQTAALRDAFLTAARAPYMPSPRGIPQARHAVAQSYAATGIPVDPERVILTASSSESYGFLWKLLCDPGDTVLVPEPSYPLFDYLARLDGVNVLPYRLTHDGSRSGDWHIDLPTVDAALHRASSPVGALVIVSPNNPTGSVLHAEDLAALDRRATTHGFALIADEVFADYVPRPAPTHVLCTAARATSALTFSLGGLSKSCGLPQLKLGWIIAGGPAPLAIEALDRLDLIADTYLSVATPVQVALPQLLRLGHARRQEISARLAENRAVLQELCSSGTRSALTVFKADGGWSAIIRLPSVQTDEEWALTLINQDGVLAHPGYFFDLRDSTCLVVSLLPSPTLFREAVQRIAARVQALLR